MVRFSHASALWLLTILSILPHAPAVTHPDSLPLRQPSSLAPHSSIPLPLSSLPAASLDATDAYYGQAKTQGFRARSAFKLLELDEEHSLLHEAHTVVDLAAAPGSWCQVIKSRQPEGGVVVAVDIQPMQAIDGVTVVQGDITVGATVDKIEAALGGRKADLVVSDAASDVTGMHELDEYCCYSLVSAGLGVARTVLKPGGTFVCKVFVRDQSRPIQESLLYTQLRALFGEVTVCKPPSSRRSSHEHFAVCKRFTLEGAAEGGAVKALVDHGSLGTAQGGEAGA